MRAPVQRISDEPAYVLHRYDWSESSLILDVFTRHHGRVALVAKGAKRPSSHFRPVLLPLQPLRLSYSGDAEVRTLKGAEWLGGHLMPGGEALLSGYYLNELLMRLLAREDPHPEVFDLYAATVRLLAQGEAAVLQWALRAFELLLLRALGLLPDLHVQTLSLQPLEAQAHYTLVPGAGLQWVGPEPAEGGMGLPGQQWQALQTALAAPEPLLALLQDCSACLPALQKPLRRLLTDHCGVATLKTRQVMVDLHNLSTTIAP